MAFIHKVGNLIVVINLLYDLNDFLVKDSYEEIGSAIGALLSLRKYIFHAKGVLVLFGKQLDRSI